MPPSTESQLQQFLSLWAAVQDGTIGALVTIDAPHHEVHEGEMWLVSGSADAVGDDASLDFLFRTPANRATHFTHFSSAGGDAALFLYEGPTLSDDGTPYPVHNLNRYSAATASMLAFISPTVDDTGVAIFQTFLPGGNGPNAVGGMLPRNTEWILKAETDYLLRVRNLSGQAQPLAHVAEFYHH